MGGSRGVIFGTVNLADPQPLTTAMIIILAVIIVIDLIMKTLKVYAEKYGVEEILHKLQYELMVLGLISFIIFIIQTVFSENVAVTQSEYFVSIGMADMIVLFIAFCFIVEAIILVQFSRVDGKNYLQMVCFLAFYFQVSF